MIPFDLQSWRSTHRSVSSVECILMPINIDNSHWVVVFAHMDTSRHVLAVSMHDPTVSPETHGIPSANCFFESGGSVIV